MKLFKTIFFSLILSAGLFGQDYFNLYESDSKQSHYYPYEAKFIIVEPSGLETEIQKDSMINLEGPYHVEVKAPWSQKREIYKSEKGQLKINILDQKYLNYNVDTEKLHRETLIKKPFLVSRKIQKSMTNDKIFTLRATFSNDLVFTILDGIPLAKQRGENIEVTNRYLIPTLEGMLKISFDQGTGEFWYVFDNK